MKELVLDKHITLMHVPSDQHLYGIALPTAVLLTKDGLGECEQYDAREAARYLHVNRKIGEYTRRWGARVFYLGTFGNARGGKFRLFSFPSRYAVYGPEDMTIISRSAEQLVSITKKFKVELCLLPLIAAGLGVASYENCVRPVLQLILNDDFVVVYRPDDVKG